MKVVVKADILGQNEAAAAENAALFARHGIYALNLLGSPGCGVFQEVLEFAPDTSPLGGGWLRHCSK